MKHLAILTHLLPALLLGGCIQDKPPTPTVETISVEFDAAPPAPPPALQPSSVPAAAPAPVSPAPAEAADRERSK